MAAAIARLCAMLRLAVLVGAIALMGAAPAHAAFTDADYLAFADRLAGGLDERWSEPRGAYVGEHDVADTRENAAMLLTHSIAALAGHRGDTRRDARARRIVDRLTAVPAWLGTWPAPAPSLSTCWSTNLDRPVREHMSLEPKVAEALAWAWRARTALGLSQPAVQRIAATVGFCAYSAAWRYPRRLLNQINWSAEMYASAATVTGRPDLLVGDYRAQLADFASGITRPMGGMSSPNLGAGYQFHYRPDHRDRAPSNFDAPEYANINAHALAHYERAIALGMPPLPAASVQRLRAWVTRLLAGSWTHAGYLNWDTSRGFRRWHSGQYWTFALQGLQAIAVAPRFWQDPRDGAWAKSMFDQSLVLYRRLADADDSVFAPRLMFGVDTRMKNFALFRVRMLAAAARAVGLGLGSLPSVAPAPLYAYDYDTGRLAITTPRYSTAIVPDDRGALHYGGIDPARLFGPGQRVASGTGGRPPGAFGMVVYGPSGRTFLATQRPRRGARIEIVRSPRGSLRRPQAYPPHPYAGPFKLLEARGRLARHKLRVESDYRFRRGMISGRWEARCRRRCPPYTVRVHFPTWGRINAVLRDGTRVRLATGEPRRQVPLSAVDHVDLDGYRIARLNGPPGAVLSAVEVKPEPTNPTPAPSLAVELTAGHRFQRVSLAAAIEPVG
jgi:hypothetical protein